jgi:hypothetical protein
VIGLLALVFLWFWPRGVIPERRRRFTRVKPAPPPAPDTLPDPTLVAEHQ